MRKLILILTCFFFKLLNSNGQGKQVLLEHFTNASCEPCYEANANLDALLHQNQKKVISLRYQTIWPGVDPMNATNRPDVAARVAYNGITIIPHSVIDGNFFSGSPGDVTQSKIDDRLSFIPKIQISVGYKLIKNIGLVSDSIVVFAGIRSRANIPAGYKIHLVVVEKEIVFPNPPGTNGEKRFEGVMRKMLPNAEGTVLPAMFFGDSLTFSFKWLTSKPNGASVFYDISKVSAIAFVQTQAKEVLNSAFSGPISWFSIDKLSNTNFTKLKAAEEVSFDFSVKSNEASNQLITLKKIVSNLPTGWAVQILSNGVAIEDNANITFTGRQNKVFTLKILGSNTGNLAKKIKVSVQANSTSIFPDLSKELVFTTFTPTNLLFLDLNSTSLPAFDSSFRTTNQSYVALQGNEVSDLDTTNFQYLNINKIFYSTGFLNSGTINNERSILFKKYLSFGGKIFFAGKNIGFEVNRDENPSAQNFYSTWMGAVFLDDGPSGQVGIFANANDPLLGPYFSAPTLLGGPGNFPDLLTVSSPSAKSFLQYSNGTTAGIYNSNAGWKTVYIGFAIEALKINGQTFLNTLVGKSIDWFDGVLSTNEFENTSEALSIFPNPAHNSVFFRLKSGKTEISLINILGQMVQKLEVNVEKSENYALDLKSLSAGIYLVQILENGKSTMNKKLIIQ